MSHIDTIQGAERLMQALLALHTREECHAFLEDICTIKEVQDISQRIEVAFMLDEGKNYQEISKATGASTATISRVKNVWYTVAADTARRWIAPRKKE